jgi:hypothetical protein
MELNYAELMAFLPDPGSGNTHTVKGRGNILRRVPELRG